MPFPVALADLGGDQARRAGIETNCGAADEIEAGGRYRVRLLLRFW
jgi:hypothetical protein